MSHDLHVIYTEVAMKPEVGFAELETQVVVLFTILYRRLHIWSCMRTE